MLVPFAVITLLLIQQATSANSKEFRICFQETEGSSQCQGTRSDCSDWSGHADVTQSAAWTNWFRDDTDGRGGGCKYQWKVDEREISPVTTTIRYI